jgi:hypothetical protein
MVMRLTVLALAAGLWMGIATAQERSDSPRPRPDGPGGQGPPPQAYEDCRGRRAGDTVQHRTREGVVAATCIDTPQGLAARPHHPPSRRPDERSPQGAPSRGPRNSGGNRQYSIAQATSDNAQLHTIAFSGLAFLTGDFGSDTFLPPGKVSDYFGTCGTSMPTRGVTTPPS